MAFLPTTTEPEALIEEYAVEVARRLGYKGPQARNQAVLKALQTLIDVLPPPPMTEEEWAESKARWDAIVERGRQYRKEHPYDDDNPTLQSLARRVVQRKGVTQIMVADTSALIAILAGESDAQIFADAMRRNRPTLVSTGTAVELLIVALGKGEAIYRDAVTLLHDPDIEIVQLDLNLILAAGEANRRYGKGRHPAALNFGDTFAYALASIRNLPLLFKGNDFARTNVTPAV